LAEAVLSWVFGFIFRKDRQRSDEDGDLNSVLITIRLKAGALNPGYSVNTPFVTFDIGKILQV
jgi:hypothetical protein